MALRSEDFVAMRINWGPKPDSVVAICRELNLGLEQVLFVDDNPIERELMRQRLPQVKVLDLPADPTAYTRCLLESPFVACLALTEEDRRRTVLYRARSAAETARADAGGDAREFVRSLGVTIHVQPLDETNLERAAQLMAKTNQFNTTTRRYSAAQLGALVADRHSVIVIGAEDRFVPRENIGVLVLRQASPTTDAVFIDDYLLSCRALGKGIETAVLRWLSIRLRSRGWRWLVGQIIETERNSPVRSVFEEAAFESGEEPGIWRKNLAQDAGAFDPPATVTFADTVADSQFPTRKA